jgi:HSP20 family protein
MTRFQRDFDRLVDGFGANGRRWPVTAPAYPALNVWEDADHVYAEAELPGLKLQDLEIYVTGPDQLTIKGNRKPVGPEKAVWHRQERGFGEFTRILTLPVPVDADQVEARLEHGVLTLRMAKSAEAKPKKIAVKAE